MSQFEKTKSGIIIPSNKKKPVAVRCGYCPGLIWKEQEAKGRLFMTKEGKPICARCRILKGAMGKRILADRPKYDKDMKFHRERAERAERRKMEQIARASQLRNPEVALRK